MNTASCINSCGYLNFQKFIKILSKIILGLAMFDSQIGSIKKAHCPFCDGSRNCRVEGYFKKPGSDEEDELWFYNYYYLLVCQGCSNAFLQIEYHYSEELLDSIGVGDDYFEDYKPTIETWPSPPKRRIPERFEKHGVHIFGNYSELLGRMLCEVYEAYEKDLLILASVGIRTCFDIVSTSIGLNPNLTFTKKLEKLRDGGHITEKEKDNLAVLVEAGNASAHRGWSPHSEEVNILLNILENFIENTIIKPIETKMLEETVATIKEKIPPRPSRKK